VSPLTRQGDPLHDWVAPDHRTLYPVIGLPFGLGAVQLTVAEELPATALTAEGAAGRAPAALVAVDWPQDEARKRIAMPTKAPIGGEPIERRAVTSVPQSRKHTLGRRLRIAGLERKGKKT
jgi:hypothetical protein